MDSELSYTVYLPPELKDGGKYPVIYALHGMGSNEENMLKVIEELKADFILIGIRGSIIQDDGFAYFTIKGYGNPDRDSFDAAVNSLRDFINEAIKEYPIDLHNQYLVGFSQGAILSMTLAIVMGVAIKGIAALSGYIPELVKEEYKDKTLEHLSAFISHGDSDPIFSLNIGKENAGFFKERGSCVSFNSYPAGHEVSEENKEDLIKWLYNEVKTLKG